MLSTSPTCSSPLTLVASRATEPRGCAATSTGCGRAGSRPGLGLKWYGRRRPPRLSTRAMDSASPRRSTPCGWLWRRRRASASPSPRYSAPTLRHRRVLRTDGVSRGDGRDRRDQRHATGGSDAWYSADVRHQPAVGRPADRRRTVRVRCGVASAGHKGYGLGVVVDLLCGPLAGAAWDGTCTGRPARRSGISSCACGLTR